jgi:hypothetical protein
MEKGAQKELTGLTSLEMPGSRKLVLPKVAVFRYHGCP